MNKAASLPLVILRLPPPRHPFVIVNPAAGRGRRSRRVSQYLALLRDHLGDVRHAATRRPGEEAELADRALAEGADLLIAIGGDGTWGNVCDRIVASGRPDVALALLPAGTGNDFARSLGIRSGEPEAAVRVVTHGRPLQVDVGRVTLTAGGVTTSRSFLLVAGFGIDTEVLEDVARARFIPGALVYRLAALRQLLSFDAVPLEYSNHAGRQGDGAYLMLAVCNGPSIGGSFRVTPRALPTDGRLHACAIRDGSILERLRIFHRASRGEHGDSPLVELFELGRLTVRFRRPLRYQLDGELQPGRVEEAEIEAVSRAVRVMTPRAGDPARDAS